MAELDPSGPRAASPRLNPGIEEFLAESEHARCRAALAHGPLAQVLSLPFGLWAAARRALGGSGRPALAPGGVGKW